jgi:hypothetical protein
MDTSAVQAWVEDNLAQMKDSLGLYDWKVKVGYKVSGGEVMGDCSADIKYQHAYINLDSSLIQDEVELKELLQHELLHIHHAPFTLLWDALQPLVGDDSAKSLETTFSCAMELTVKSLERLLKSQEERYESHNPNQRERNLKRGSGKRKQVRNRNRK